MVFGWRRSKASRTPLPAVEPVPVPTHFLCPISLDLMTDPVTLSSGITYDRESIETWLENGHFSCPLSTHPLTGFDMIPNHSLRKMIQEWCVANPSSGIPRIPTPRVPVSPFQVSHLLMDLKSLTHTMDQRHCLDLVLQLKKWATESERNRRCIVVNKASGVLAAVFDTFAKDGCFAEDRILLQEILSAINLIFPLGDIVVEDALPHLSSKDSLLCLLWFLKSRDVAAKRNSVMALKEILSSGQQHVIEAVAGVEGLNEVLFQFVKDPISPAITKASLMAIFFMVSLSHDPIIGRIKSSLVKMGLVPLLLETVIDSERSVSEKGLGVFSELIDCAEGREEAIKHELTVPVLVKKMLRISELATQYAVSGIWKLCRNGERKDEERVLVEALQVGGFQKLVLVLQIGCEDETKEKTTQLLKSMNPLRSGLECTESVDFKNLKRSF